MTLKPYHLDDVIPVDERTAIRAPRVCFVETKNDISGAADSGSRYSAVVQKYNGQIIRNQSESNQSLILKSLDDTQYDFLVLIDSDLAPSPESISALTESALCHPDVALMVPVGNYAPSTHAQKFDSAEQVEIIPYADLSICTINLKIIRPLRSGLANCNNDDDFLCFLQRRIRGESYFIAKVHTILVNGEKPSTHHPYDEKILPANQRKEIC